MKFTHATLITFLGLLQCAYTLEDVSWVVFTRANFGSDQGEITGHHVMPATPSVGTCPVTDKICVSFESSHSISATHADGDYTTLYIHAWTGADCSGDWTAFSVTDSANFDVDTGGPVKSIALMAGLCGPPW